MEDKLRNMTSIYLCHKDKILLLYRVGSKVIGNSYIGSAGGHFIENELNDPKACVLRELYEEIGLKEEDLVDLKLRYITLRSKNQEIRQNYYFFAGLKAPDQLLTSNEGQLHWIKDSEVMTLEMPFTAKCMIEHYLCIGKYTDYLYGGITTPNGIEFTRLEEFE